MMQSRSYKFSFLAALAFHLTIAILLLAESTHERPVLTPATQMEASLAQPLEQEPKKEEAIKAVSVDENEVKATVNRLKEERLHQQQAEANKQRALEKQAEAAREQRVLEQQRVEKLKNEAAKLAIAHEKQVAEEQHRLKELAKQKEAEEKHLAEIKKEHIKLQKQQEEAKKQAELANKKKMEDLARANQEREAKAKKLLMEQQAAAADQARLTAEKNARLAGEVDKYKAMIINAISRQWILPENANGNLSSQFRIRLAPNGAVLEVSLTRSSGDAVLDRSAQSAIYKASPLPVPSDPDTFNLFRDISLTVRPENARG